MVQRAGNVGYAGCLPFVSGTTSPW
jgi:hypothetical protein